MNKKKYIREDIGGGMSREVEYQESQHTPTPKYGIDEAGMLMQDIGLLHAIRTLDPLTHEVNEGSNTLAYCVTQQQAELIVRAVNSHEALLDALKWLLATAPNDNYDIGYQEARQASAKAIRQAEDK